MLLPECSFSAVPHMILFQGIYCNQTPCCRHTNPPGCPGPWGHPRHPMLHPMPFAIHLTRSSCLILSFHPECWPVSGYPEGSGPHCVEPPRPQPPPLLQPALQCVVLVPMYETDIGDPEILKLSPHSWCIMLGQ